MTNGETEVHRSHRLCQDSTPLPPSRDRQNLRFTRPLRSQHLHCPLEHGGTSETPSREREKCRPGCGSALGISTLQRVSVEPEDMMRSMLGGGKTLLELEEGNRGQ